MWDLLLINSIIITMNSQHTVWENGYIAIKNKIISDIGDMKKINQQCDSLNKIAKKVIDLKGKPLLPGLIDGHGHAGHCMTRTLAEHLSGDEWEDFVENIYYSLSDEEFWYIEGKLAAAERLKFGITTGVSMIGNTPRIDDIWPLVSNMCGSSETGIHQISGIGSANGPWPKKAVVYNKDGTSCERDVLPEAAWETTRRALEYFADKKEIGKCIVMPGRMGYRRWESVEMNIKHNQEMIDLSKEFDVPIHTHAYGGDVKFLYENNREAFERHLSLTHSTGYSEEEVEVIADSDAYVFHGPTTYSNINNLCPIVTMINKGVNVAIVTDGTAPDRSFDLWRDMKNARLLQRAHYKDTSLLGSGKLLEMTTIEPAKALGIDEFTGSLEIGKSADLISINTNQMHLMPFKDMPIQRLVDFAMGQDVEMVITDGELVMLDRKLLKIDEEKLCKDSLACYDKMMTKVSRRDIIENKKLFCI